MLGVTSEAAQEKSSFPYHQLRPLQWSKTPIGQVRKSNRAVNYGTHSAHLHDSRISLAVYSAPLAPIQKVLTPYFCKASSKCTSLCFSSSSCIFVRSFSNKASRHDRPRANSRTPILSSCLPPSFLIKPAVQPWFRSQVISLSMKVPRKSLRE